MFITNHALAGVAIGLVVRRPLPALVAGVASHLAMDTIPHWGDDRLDWDEFVQVGKVDGVVGLAACASAMATAPRGTRVPMAAAIFGACVIDMEKPCRHFLGRSPFPPAFDRFHSRIQTERPVGWVVEAVAGGVLAGVMWPRLHRRITGHLGTVRGADTAEVTTWRRTTPGARSPRRARATSSTR
jgi:hypothetical protein